ncbi:MAG: ComF family protein [Candidatus Kerfeldbacteria bacterium]|nr:ComF family protein [Candidatus Kerfeldbacteria bacterium]
MSTLLTAFTKFFVRTLFPASCVGCGTMDTWLCTSCLEGTPVTPERRCAACLKTLGTHIGCQHPLTTLFSTGPYRETVLADAIQSLKYQYVSALAEPLGVRVAAVLRPHCAAWAPAVIVPIPLHSRRFRERGFNQAERIARAAGTILNLPVRTDILHRRRKTHRQVGLERDERLQNLQNAFVVVKRIPLDVRTVILLDDVWTTGATLTAAADILHSAGVERVIGCVVASDAPLYNDVRRC